MGIDWDEGPEVGGPHEPYFQSQRAGRYEQAVQRLLECGAAYRDYALTEEIQAEREEAQQAKRQFRYSRRWIMIIADTGAALVTAITFLLLFFGDLQIWHIYLLAFFGSSFSAFQEPAYTASVTMMVPKEQLARSSGITQMGQAISVVLTPLMAGALYGLVGLNGIIMIDALTYFFAIGALLIGLDTLLA